MAGNPFTLANDCGCVEYLSGDLLTSDGFVKGSVGIENGIILELSKHKVSEPVAKGIVIPAFCNAHTHIGDAFIRTELKGTVEELVAPPHGLKHRLLAKASESEVVTGIRSAVKTMIRTGTGSFWDFRENSVAGAKMLYDGCLGEAISPVCLGRPNGLKYNSDEVRALLRVCDGLGVSSARDWPRPDIEKLALNTRRMGKIFATHCSEAVREDINSILDLKPTFLVHMLHATESDLEKCAETNVPIVVCPRSNAFFGRIPNIPLMISKGVTLLLGTDNAMLAAPSMLREMEFALRAARLKGDALPSDIVRMAVSGRKGLSGTVNNGFQIGETACLAVISVPTGEDPYSAILKATEHDVALVWMGEKKWQRERERKAGEKPQSQRQVHLSRKRSRRRKRGYRPPKT